MGVNNTRGKSILRPVLENEFLLNNKKRFEKFDIIGKLRIQRSWN